MANPPLNDFKVCLHTCTHKKASKKPPSMIGVEIYTVDSNGKPTHVKSHTCPPESRCVEVEDRTLDNSDWVKFGRAIYLGRNGQRKKDVLQRYKDAWRAEYQDQEALDDTGNPRDLLHNPDYKCRQPVPWWKKSPQVIPTPQQPQPTSGSMQDHEVEILSGKFPTIKGGLNPGFMEDLGSKEKLRAFFILIPQYIITNPDDPIDCDVSKVEVEPADAAAINSVMAGCIIPVDPNTDASTKQEYYHTSWLSLAMEMREKKDRWEVKYLAWDDFRDATVLRKGSYWDRLRQADIIIGGINFTSNYLESAQSIYGLTLETLRIHWDTLGILAEHAFMWPDPRDLLFGGSKLYLSQNISKCSEDLGFPSPIIATVSDPLKVLQDIQGGTIDAVLKRDYSSTSLHVFTKYTPDATERLMKTLADEEQAYGPIRGGPFRRPMWIIQPFLSPLLHLGEIRAFVVNGSIINILTTTPHNNSTTEIDIAQATFVRPLSTILLENQNKTNTTWLADPEMSPFEQQRHKPDDIFEIYLLKMLSKLIVEEERTNKFRSGLRIFNRFDVSVFKIRDTGKIVYTMNEITRSHFAGLFQAWDTQGCMDIMFQELERTLHLRASQSKKVRGSRIPAQ